MPTFIYHAVTWTGVGGATFNTGDIQDGAYGIGLAYGDVVTASGHPIVGNPASPPGSINIDNLHIERSFSGNTIALWKVRNSGPTPIDGYAVGLIIAKE
jgi:hypothetical protein